MKIAVAGTGYVGLVSGVCLAEMGHEVVCVDTDQQKIQSMKKGISPIYEDGLEEMMRRNYREGRVDYTTDYAAAYRDARVIFIGGGTPERPDGSADLSYVTQVARQIAESVESDCLVVIKSTVPVGTNDKVEQYIKDFLKNDVHIEVASNPEFLSQGTAVRDTLKARRIVIGTNSKGAEKLLREIYEPFHLPIVSVTRRSAEIIKYAANDFLALKISYMNEIANLCELVGANVQDVAEGMGYDTRIGKDFLKAGIGYGGSCFPKDTKALDFLARQKGYMLKTVRAAIEVNETQSVRLFEKAQNRLLSFRGLKTAILGLTFKPGTDDLRAAPSLKNIELLLNAGADLYVYDPVGCKGFKQKYSQKKIEKGSITYCDDAEFALRDANICFIFTEWKEIKEIMPEQYGIWMKNALVYDGRNIYSPEDMRKAGVEYYSIGRP